jgi:acetyl esterase/lipase
MITVKDSAKAFLLIFFFQMITSTDSIAQSKKIPVDSTYTPVNAWKNIKKDYPATQIAVSVLPEGIISENNLIYATLENTPYGRRDLHLDIYHPDGKGKYPVLVMIHGGGWRSGNKAMEAPMAQKIAAAGFVTVPVEYRLSLEAQYPAAVNDIKAAIRWLRANAEKYNIDTAHIAIEGNSAGGQLAALVAFTNNLIQFEGNQGIINQKSNVHAIIDIDGLVDFLAPGSLNLIRKSDSPDVAWLGGQFIEKPAIWKEASPIFWVNKNSVPILFVNSTRHRFHAGSDELLGLMDQYNIYSEEHTIPDTPHTFWLFHPWFEPTVAYIITFLKTVFPDVDGIK